MTDAFAYALTASGISATNLGSDLSEGQVAMLQRNTRKSAPAAPWSRPRIYAHLK
ncbi:MAG: hypothetical protein AAGC95_03480 [Pseudomonadota bacterium]